MAEIHCHDKKTLTEARKSHNSRKTLSALVLNTDFPLNFFTPQQLQRSHCEQAVEGSSQARFLGCLGVLPPTKAERLISDGCFTLFRHRQLRSVLS